MLIENLKQLGRVKRALNNVTWFCFDTETEGSPDYPPDKDAALIIGRPRVRMFSLATLEHSFSFPTNLFHPEYPAFVEWMEKLWPYFHSNRTVVMHNANYDLNVLWAEHKRFAKVKRWYCTMIGGFVSNDHQEKGLKPRAIKFGVYLRATKKVDFTNKKELARYAEQDVEVTARLYAAQMGLVPKKDRMDEYIPKAYRPFLTHFELEVLKCVLEGERRGIKFDSSVLAKLRKKVEKIRIAKVKKLYKLNGGPFNLNSGPQLGEFLAKQGLTDLPKTKTGQPQTSSGVLTKLVEQFPVVKEVLDIKLMVKQQSVYIGLPGDAKKTGLDRFKNKDGRIHCTVNPVGTNTGRASATTPNLQQIPSRKDIFGIRKGFVAPKGFKLICLDFGQLELRVMANLSRDPRMSAALQDPAGDPHQVTADEFGVARSPTAKQLNFLLLFGGGPYMLAKKLTEEMIPTSESQAKIYHDTYGRVYPGIVARRKAWVQEYLAEGFVRYWIGRKRHLDFEVDPSKYSSLHKAETKLANNIVQGSGQDFLKAAIIRSNWRRRNPDLRMLKDFKGRFSSDHADRLADYGKRLDRYRKLFRSAQCEWLLQVHDENLFQVRAEAAHECAKKLATIMTWRHFFPSIMEPTVPLTVDGGVADNWKDAKGDEPEIKIHAGFGKYDN